MLKATQGSLIMGAPAGAPILSADQKPAITGQGSSAKKIDASPTRISRMLRTIFENEKQIRAWEDMSASTGKRYVMGDNGKLKWVKVKDLVGDSLREAKETRDQHLAEVRHIIDYALTTDAYEDVACPKCQRGPALKKLAASTDIESFITSIDFEPPAIDCKKCKGARTVRAKKKGKRAAKRFKRITYWGKVLDDTVRCSKIRMGTRESDGAYEELEAANKGLLHKFSKEAQTSLEEADAAQGVRQGLIDAAMRFDPTRKEGAVYNTVAYNWCYRNSRARQNGQKRAGLCGQNLGNMGTEEGNMESLVTDNHGTIGTFTPNGRADNSLVIDLRTQLAELPPEAREVVTHEMGGLSTAEISKKMGISRAKVRSLRTAAFSFLRATLTGYVDVVSD